MEKVLINKHGDYMIYDTQKNSLAYSSEKYTCDRRLIKLRTDGQVITENEVIDVKAGDIVIPQSFYSRKEEKYICKVVVISDATASYDLEEIERIKREHEEYKKDE